MMIVNAIQCKACGDIVFSRCVHDMRFCGCGNVAADGGREYWRYLECGKGHDLCKLQIPEAISEHELWLDFERCWDEYGILSPSKEPK